MHGHEEGAPCPRCGTVLVRRNDDTAEALACRLDVYRNLTLPLVGYYESTVPQIFHRVEAEEGFDMIFKALYGLVRG